MPQEVSPRGLLTSDLQTTAWPCRGANSCRALERRVVWPRRGGWLLTITSTTRRPGRLAPRRATPDHPASASQHSWLTVRMVCPRRFQLTVSYSGHISRSRKRQQNKTGPAYHQSNCKLPLTVFWLYILDCRYC